MLDLLSNAAQFFPENGLSVLLELSEKEKRPLRVKFGIDPSGSELTLGHAVVLRKLRQFQDAGHTAVLVIGDFTAQVGDPSGKSVTRSEMTLQQTQKNAETYLAQALKVLSADNLEVRFNSEWLNPMSLMQVIFQARNITVAQMLERDDFSKRFKVNAPIALSEFIYPLLQGFDSVQVHADIELGGSDQLFNLMVGRTLQKAAGMRQQMVLTMPILVGLDGVKKMSKSLNNFIALTEAPNEQFGKIMSIKDELILTFAALCTNMSPSDFELLRELTTIGGKSAGVAKRKLACSIVTLLHGVEAAAVAEEHFNALFKKHQAPKDMAEFTLSEFSSSEILFLPEVLVWLGLASSNNEARTHLKAHAVKINGVVFLEFHVASSQLQNAIVQIGKRRFAKVV